MTNEDAISGPEKAPTAAELYSAPHLQPTLTFDTLVTGRSNKLAVAAAREVVMEPGRHYNLQFIFGGIGVGKTHLLHAVGNTAFESTQTAT